VFDDLTIEQLLVLQRGLLEAKFSPNPRDSALQGSPILAELTSSIVQEIRERYALEGDENRVNQWTEWARWSKRTVERRLVRDHLRELEAWEKMSADSRYAYVRALIAPFEASDGEIAELIHDLA
jgi:hypothetical protein